MNNPFSIITEYSGDLASLLDTPLPDAELPLLPLRGMMMFPCVVGAVNVTRESSLALLQEAETQGSVIAVVTQRYEDAETPDTASDFYSIGVAARVLKIIELPGDHRAAILQSLMPLGVKNVRREGERLYLTWERLEEIMPQEGDEEFDALAENIRDAAVRYVRTGEQVKMESLMAIQSAADPMFLINFLASNFGFTIEEKDELLRQRELKKRGLALLQLIQRDQQYASIKNSIRKQTMQRLDEQQKEMFLRQEIETIQGKLGEDKNPEIKLLREKLEASLMPDEAKERLAKEIKKLEHLNEGHPDFGVQLAYLQTMLALPWGQYTDDTLDAPAAARTLDRDHFGLTRVKERILEHLAAMKYSTEKHPPILCLVGPPGVGKTSLGKSVAEALGRKYVRVSLGGVHDEAEIRGHRRTYVASMPGRIIKGIQKAEVSNPLFVLDEIDKVSGATAHGGDPQSALLEVLDPEQNHAFHDNYLDIDYDLSRVFFIATANTLQTIARPLLDRMEIVQLDGYLTEEKMEIAGRHLIPRLQSQYRFPENGTLRVSRRALAYLIEHYTRESGVRQLEQTLARLFRKTALALAGENPPSLRHALKVEDVKQMLGKEPYHRDRWDAGGRGAVGVVTGLAWTAVGGEILFIETSVSPSKTPSLTLTGNLGDVMKESAMLALEYVKAHAESIGFDPALLSDHSVHVHVPEGATPKDGPSAGITMATSIASALTGRSVRGHLAMTGEITLRGRVLPVGGIKEKILAAKRAGVTDILLSVDNEKDIEELEADFRKGLTFHFVRKVDEVLKLALVE